MHRRSTVIAVLASLMLLLLLPFAGAEGTYRALLVGVDRFVTLDDTSPAAANNVARMAQALQGGAIGYEKVTTSITALTDDAALEALVLDTFADAQAGDVSCFYISTHGVLQDDDPAAMTLLLSDGADEGGVTAQRLREIFDQVPGTKLLILDACHAGATIGKGVHPALDNVFAGGDYKILCSSGGAEESWLWYGGRNNPTAGAGYFSGALTHGVTSAGAYGADHNRDGSVTLTEMKAYLLEHHGASTVRTYPEADDFVLFRYDPALLAANRRDAAIDAISFYSDVMEGEEPTVEFSFTVRRPVRVAYQLVYQEDDRWDFENASIIWDDTERYSQFGDASGYLSPGMKERSISIAREDESSHGYVLLQILTVNEGSPEVISSRVLCVPPLTGNPQLEFRTQERFTPAAGEELAFTVLHQYPCEMSLTIEDSAGNTVRRLASRQATRPERLLPLGSARCWDGRLTDGTLAPPGEYRIRATAWIGMEQYTLLSDPIVLADPEASPDQPRHE